MPDPDENGNGKKTDGQLNHGVFHPDDLNGQPFMLLEHGGKTEVSELLEEHQVKPDIRFTSWDDYAILSMVESSLGIGVLPRLILQRIPYKVEIRSLPNPFYREIGFAMKAAAQHPPRFIGLSSI